MLRRNTVLREWGNNMTNKEIRKKVYNDKDRDLGYKLKIFFRLYSVRPVEETKLLKLRRGEYTIYYFEERYNLFNPLTWLYIIVSMQISIIVLFISDFLLPVFEAIIGIPKELKTTQKWNRRVLDRDVYEEV